MQSHEIWWKYIANDMSTHTRKLRFSSAVLKSAIDFFAAKTASRLVAVTDRTNTSWKTIRNTGWPMLVLTKTNLDIPKHRNMVRR